jgi:MYXO-CTERM domain-containing protein
LGGSSLCLLVARWVGDEVAGCGVSVDAVGEVPGFVGLDGLAAISARRREGVGEFCSALTVVCAVAALRRCALVSCASAAR